MSVGKRIAERQNDRRKSFEVPEWGEDGGPLVIFHDPWLMIDQEKLSRLHPKWMDTMSGKAFVEAIVMKSEDKDGQKIFGADDKPILMREKASLISRVAGAIMTSDTVEEHEKN